MNNTTAQHETLQITGCQVYLLKEPSAKTRAMVRVVLNDQLQLTGMRIVDGANGLFVAYPNDPGYKGDDYRSLFYPVTKELRDHIEFVVIAKYQEVLKSSM
jgi:stage V sporulation protein G